MPKFGISANGLILSYHGDITIATIWSYLAVTFYKRSYSSTYFSDSLCSPPKAITVRMEERTCSATALDDAYSYCSLAVK